MAKPNDREGNEWCNCSSPFLINNDDSERDAVIDGELQTLMQDPEMHKILKDMDLRADPVLPLRSETPPHISLWRLREIALRPKTSFDAKEQEHFRSCAFCEANRVRMVSELWHPELKTMFHYHDRRLNEADLEQIETHLNVSRCEKCRIIDALLVYSDGLSAADSETRICAAARSLEYFNELETIATISPRGAEEFRQIREYLLRKTEDALSSTTAETSPTNLPLAQANRSIDGAWQELSRLS